MTGCLLNNKPPDSGERLTPHKGAPSVWGSKPCCPRVAQPHTPTNPGGAKGVTHLCPPVTCTPCPVTTADDRASRHLGVGGSCSSAPTPLASLSFCIPPSLLLGFPWASPVAQLVKNPPAMQETGFDPCIGKIPWRRERLLSPYSGLENSMDCIVHGAAKSRTRLSGFHFIHPCPWSSLSSWPSMLGPGGHC